jgi:cobalt-zinc-cadmium efflux system membrane fusion protein
LDERNATSAKVLNSSKSSFEVANIAFLALHKKLQLMNINPNTLTPENIRTTISVTSPISGYITAVNITKGMFLDPQQIAISVEGVDHKHMEFEVYEKDLSNIKIGNSITMVSASNLSKKYQGEVFMIDKSIHPQNRTVKIHGHFIEQTEKIEELLPKMYIEGEIFGSSNQVAALPQSAIISQNDAYFILLLTETTDNEYYFTKKEVMIGETLNGYTQILNLSEIDLTGFYLTKGAYQLIQ